MTAAPLDLENLAEEETNAALRELDRSLGFEPGPPSLVPTRPTSPTQIETRNTKVVSVKPERRLGRRAAKAGIAASLIGLLTTALVTFGPRAADLLGETPSPPPAPASAAPDTTTYATQVALDAAMLRIAQLERCPDKPVAGTTCARLFDLERCSKLADLALASMNGKPFGPNWPFPVPTRFSVPRTQPPPRVETNIVWPCPEEQGY